VCSSLTDRMGSSRFAIIIVLVLALGVGSYFALNAGEDAEAPSASIDLPEGCADVEAPEPEPVNLARPTERVPRGEELQAAMETSCGDFVIDLATEDSPTTVTSFAYLADQGVYDETIFHRIVPGFVVQGGDPLGDGTGGPGYFVDEPPPQNTVYRRGVVAMAKAATDPPGRSESQFFIVVAPADAGLPPDYAVLGEVSEGIETVERIAELGDPASGEIGTPLAPVVLESVTVG